MYRNDGACGFWLKILSLNLDFKKGYFLAKFLFYIRRSMEITGKGELHFHQETPSLIGNQTNHKTNMFLPN